MKEKKKKRKKKPNILASGALSSSYPSVPTASLSSVILSAIPIFQSTPLQHQFQKLLQANQLDDNIKKALAVAFCVNTATEHEIKPIEDDVDVVDNAVDNICYVPART